MAKKNIQASIRSKPKQSIHAVAQTAAAEDICVVGIGASAGGIEALLKFFTALNPAPDFAYVVIQHMDPERESQMRTILSHVTKLPIVQVVNPTKLEPGKLYVNAPGTTLVLEDDTFKALPFDRKKHSAQTVDHFFESLAEAKKSKAVGVVLSGTGTDGTAGLESIKSLRGIAIAQDPSSAKHKGMPQSAIKAGVVDFVLTPEAIADELRAMSERHISGLSLTEASELPLDDKGMPQEVIQRIFFLLQSQSHIDFSTYKSSTVIRRIQRQMRLNKFDNAVAFAHFLQTHPEAVKALAEDMFIHVTEFFRDEESFEALKTIVFKPIAKKRSPGSPIRIWMPGCSTGEEPYSIAMSLLEFLGDSAANTPIQVFATDISERAVQKARSGIYTEAEVEGISGERLKRFFEKSKEGYKVRRFVRDLCIFSRHDVASSPPFAKIDLVSCRNVLIYFAQELQKKVMPIFHYALNANGFLWLGKSEVPTGFSKLFFLKDKTHKIFLRVNTATPMNLKFSAASGTHTSLHRARLGTLATPLDEQKEFDRILMSRYAPAGVMVNHDMEILQVRGHTSPYMELPTGQPTYNLMKMIKPEILPGLRSTYQAAAKEGRPVKRTGIKYEIGKERKLVDIEVTPLHLLSPAEEHRFLIVFEDSKVAPPKLPIVKHPTKKSKKETTTSTEAYVRQLFEEIDSMRDYHQTLIEGFETTQEELTSSNEELQSTNEELQSTNEELETAKEELQAANEELTTVNEELQTRNNELITVNYELSRSEERFRLLVSSVKDYAIFMLDETGHIATWNEGARRFKGYEAQEIIGKFFGIFYPKEANDTHYPEYELKMATEQGRFEDEGWRIRKDGSRFWANVVITRVNDDNGKLMGFAKVTRDLTERKRIENELRRAKEDLELRVKERTQELQDANRRLEDASDVIRKSEDQLRAFANSIMQLAWMADANGYIFWYNDRWYQFTGKSPKDMEGWGWQSVHDPAELPRVLTQWKASLESGESFDMEFPLRGADGRYRWFLTRAMPYKDSDGKIVRWFGTNTDIDDQLRIRQQLSEALGARDEFLSIASHELKTPLTSLKLQLQLAKRNQGRLSSQEIADAFSMSLKQANSLSSLVDDLLDISRIQTGKFVLDPSDFNLSELAKEVISRYQEQLSVAHIELVEQLESEIVGHWDRSRLEQVLTNLISNAIKYAPRGKLKISTSMMNGRAILAVRDTGPGIPRDQHEKIFERFERANQSRNIGGLGLGLFITKRIIEAHNGAITVSSQTDGQSDHGTEFRIILPLAPTLSTGEKLDHDFDA